MILCIDLLDADRVGGKGGEGGVNNEASPNNNRLREDLVVHNCIRYA